MNMKRLLTIALACLMLLGLLAGCKKESGDGPDTTPSGNESTGGGSTIIGPGGGSGGLVGDPYEDYENDDLPEDLDYGNAEFVILCDAAQYGKSFADVDTGDTINSAVFTRKKVVEDRLNIELKVERQTGAYNKMADFVRHLEQGGDTYDLVLSYNLTPATMAVQGLICDMNSTQYINFSKPWWSGTLLENTTINNRVYFTGDNSSWNNLRNMLGVFVDKQLFSAKHPDMDINTLYDLVENNEWTIEKMFELIEGTYEDSATPGEVTGADTFGLSVGNEVWNEAWYFAAGFTVMSQNEEGEWQINIGTDASLNFVDWFSNTFLNNDNVYRDDDKQYSMFIDQKSVMFYMSALSMVEQQPEQTFGVLPLPMYDPDLQDGYRTHFSNTYDMYCIPRALTVEDRNRSSAVLECLASEAYRRIGPAYFEVYLKSRNASDTRLADMYDIIRESIVFDVGVLFGELFVKGDNPVYFVRRVINGYRDSLGATWTTEINTQYLALWQTTLDTLEEMAG